MHRPLKFTTLIAVALAFTACADSVPRGITEPDGLRINPSLSPALAEVFDKADGLMNELYACAGPTMLANKNKDLDKIRTQGDAGKWNEVPGLVEKMIKDTDALIAKKEGGIPSTCPDYYDDATERAALRDEFVFWLNVFASQGVYTEGTSFFFSCPATGCDVYGEDGAWRVTVPPGTFGGEDVSFLVQQNNGNFPDPNFTTAGQSWHFDVFPSNAIAQPPGWTRWICWDGFDGTTDLSPEGVQMVREGEDGLDFLPTQFEEGCEPPEEVTMNPLLRGAHKLLAGMPFLPKELHAYLPPRTFGGTSTASSPHWLVILNDTENAFDALCQLTASYSPATANAGCGFIAKAKQCDIEQNGACVNSNLDQFIQVVNAQEGQSLTETEAQELRDGANALKYPTEPVLN